jgi:hypothetical protein
MSVQRCHPHQIMQLSLSFMLMRCYSSLSFAVFPLYIAGLSAGLTIKNVAFDLWRTASAIMCASRCLRYMLELDRQERCLSFTIMQPPKLLTEITASAVLFNLGYVQHEWQFTLDPTAAAAGNISLLASAAAEDQDDDTYIQTDILDDEEDEEENTLAAAVELLAEVINKM